MALDSQYDRDLSELLVPDSCLPPTMRQPIVISSDSDSDRPHKRAREAPAGPVGHAASAAPRPSPPPRPDPPAMSDGEEEEEEEQPPAAARAKRNNAKAKRWCFTVNNPEHPPVFESASMAYLVYQLERGASGTPHYQGYVRFHKRQTITGTQNKLHIGKAHVEKARGNEKQCRDYCTKADTRIEQPVEFGTYDPDVKENPGKRTDLEDITDEIIAGASIQDIARAHPGDFIRYHSGISALHVQIAPKRPPIKEMRLAVLWGPTGTGKTYRCRTRFPDAYDVPRGRFPFDSYRGEETIILDEFSWEDWTIQDFNRMVDVYRYNLSTRYQNRSADWTRVLICANSNPATWWTSTPDAPLLESARRRLRGCCFLVERRETNGGPSIEEIIEGPATPL